MRTPVAVALSLTVASLAVALWGCASTAPTAKSDGAATAAPAEAPATDKIKRSTKESGETVTEYDLNGDKKPDVWTFSAKVQGADGKTVERLLRKELDINWDGRVDIAREYDEKGELTKESLDLDFDGRVDQVNYSEKGAVVRKERDLTASGRISEWVFYEKGKVVRKERDSNGDGRVDYWEYWEGSQVDRVGEDLDGDGTVDKWTKNPNSEG